MGVPAFVIGGHEGGKGSFAGVSSGRRPREGARRIRGHDGCECNVVGIDAAVRPGMTAGAVETLASDLEITLPARAENVAVVRHAVGGLGDVLELDEQTLSDIKLAVTEACTNVVVHAYPDGEGPMGLRAVVADDGLVIVVSDRGRGIVPRADSPGLGLGLPLIATLAESLELGSGRGEETEVRMTFDLSLGRYDDERPQ
jgi:serine/threonine-protein kinase RsbW